MFTTFIQIAPRCHLAAKKTIINNQTDKFREYISKLNRNRENQNKTAIFAEGHTYLSYSEAEECLGISRRTIRVRVQANKYYFATEEQIKVEKERRSRECTGPVRQKVVSTRTGLPKEVTIDGVTYPSYSEAAKAYNISPQAMSKRIKKDQKGDLFANNDADDKDANDKDANDKDANDKDATD